MDIYMYEQNVTAVCHIWKTGKHGKWKVSGKCQDNVWKFNLSDVVFNNNTARYDSVNCPGNWSCIQIGAAYTNIGVAYKKSTLYFFMSQWFFFAYCTDILYASPDHCIPRTTCTYGGYYGLVVVTPRPPRPQTLHRSHDNLKNPYRIASIFYM